MNETWVRDFVDHWCNCWNNHDLEGILSHFTDDATFTSPKAARLAGSATLHGLESLRAYWGVAIESATSRVFTPERVIWDAARRELALIYISDVDGYRRRSVEFFRFGPDRKVFAGEAMYGAEL